MAVQVIGLYQFSSKMKVVDAFIKLMGYEEDFKNLTPATKSFNLKWKELAKNSKFADDQHEFIKKTHFDVQMKYLKDNNINLYDKNPAILDAVWSTSVQFGPKTNIIINALKDENVDNLPDGVIINKIQDYKINNNDKLFKSSSPAVRKSTLNRAINEKTELLKILNFTKKII